jgi:hypothetical protein
MILNALALSVKCSKKLGVCSFYVVLINYFWFFTLIAILSIILELSNKINGVMNCVTEP